MGNRESLRQTIGRKIAGEAPASQPKPARNLEAAQAVGPSVEINVGGQPQGNAAENVAKTPRRTRSTGRSQAERDAAVIAAAEKGAKKAVRRELRDNRRDSDSSAWPIVGLAAVIAAAGVGMYAVNELKSNPDITIPPATATPSEAAGGPTLSPDGNGGLIFSPAPESQAPATDAPESQAPASFETGTIEAVRIESAAVAAQRFGDDEYSKNPDNWEINEWGGAHLKETEKAVRVKTNGSVVEGWIKSNMVGARDAYTFVANSDVEIVELNGGTFWDFGGNPEGFAQLWKQVNDKEAIEQPDVTVIPLCGEYQPIQENDVPLVKISSPAEAAAMFGADEYSSNPNNWEINEYGGAHLIDNPKGNASLVNLNGTVAEGWIKAQRENGRNAITFVVHPNAQQARFVGATLWELTDADRGFQQVLGQVLPKEAVEQPDVNVNTVCLPTVAR